MDRIKFFFQNKFNLVFVLGSIFVLLDMKYNFFFKSTEVFVKNAFDLALVKVGFFIWAGIFVALVIDSTSLYNKK